MPIKQEPSEADLPGAGLHPDALQRTLDTVTSALPQLITAVTTLAQTAADMKRDAETTSTGLAAVLTEMKQQLTTVASAQLQTAAVLAELKTEMASLKGNVRLSNIKLDSICDEVRAQNKHQTTALLQRAMVSAEYNSFKFYTAGNDEPKSSKSDARSALQGYNSGMGMWIDEDSYVSRQPVRGLPTEDQKKAYREALQTQLHELTGQKPPLLQERNEQGQMQWAIKPVYVQR